MARPSDPPGVQAAKGNPGRRKRAVQVREADARRLADLLTAAPQGATLSDPPLLQEPLLAPALSVWRAFAPELVRTHRLPVESRPIFAQFCVYYAEWAAANEDIAFNGYSQRVKTVAGGFMERRRPVVDRRERAFNNVIELSKHFGLTPHDLYDLFKDQAAVAQARPDLFSSDRTGAGAPPALDTPDGEADPAQALGVIGAAARLRSERPAGTA